MVLKILLALVLGLAGTGATAAADAGPKVEAAWARASIGGSQLSVAYATVISPAADRLVAVETPVAERAELHSHRMKSDGTMEMRGVDAIELKPGEPVVLKPNGPYHVMLTGLKAPLKQGDSFPMTFVFEHGGRVESRVTVESARAMEPTKKQPGAGS
jgi:copper(I)-binding protein